MFVQYDELQLEEVVNDVTRAVKPLIDIEFHEVPAHQTVETYQALMHSVAVLSAAGSRLGLQIENTKAYEAFGDRDAATTIAGLSGKPRGEAMRDLKTQKKLNEKLPTAADAYRNGEPSPLPAWLVADGAFGSTDPNAEQWLLRCAKICSIEELREESRRMKSTKSPDDEASDDERKRKLRTCRVSSNRDDGMGSLYALLLLPELALWKSELDRRRDVIYRQKHKDGIDDDFDTNTTDAFMSILADAVAHSSGGCTSEAKRSPLANRYRINLFVDHDAIKRGYKDGGETVEIAGIGQVSVQAVIELLGENNFRFLVKNGIDVKTITKEGRYWTAPVEAAMTARDKQRCQVPGCNQQTWLEKDHQQWYSKDGPTCLDNGRNVCAHHHRMITNKGFRLVGEPGNWRWLKPGEIDWDP